MCTKQHKTQTGRGLLQFYQRDAYPVCTTIAAPRRTRDICKQKLSRDH